MKKKKMVFNDFTDELEEVEYEESDFQEVAVISASGKEKFENELQILNKINTELPQSVELSKVKEKFLVFDHKVTGSELNTLSSTIQTHLINQNKINVDYLEING